MGHAANRLRHQDVTENPGMSRRYGKPSDKEPCFGDIIECLGEYDFESDKQLSYYNFTNIYPMI